MTVVKAVGATVRNEQGKWGIEAATFDIRHRKRKTVAVKNRLFATDGSAQPSMSYSGIPASNSTATFDLQLNTTPGATNFVTLVATYASTLADIKNSLELGLIDNAGIANSLTSKIEAAQSAANGGQNGTALNILNAFNNELGAQSGNHINGIAPQVLQEDAASLISQLTR